ncbi:MAG: 2OG-Fe(II) oxygenase [Mycobacteriaceae bacterium]|nr:2OG-Fe(II) oxygenase [Mycobacteriaceae bacterium]
MLTERIENLDWTRLRRKLDDDGYAITQKVLTASECRYLTTLFHDDHYFRATVDMRRHRFGSGVYRYFDYPLPESVQQLRQALYPPLADIANAWSRRLDGAQSRPAFPATLSDFLEICHRHGQHRPTPLLFRYQQDDFNTLHQDTYGRVGFPFQALTVLSQCGSDFTGGEFLLVTQRPRAQSIGEAITLDRGQLLIFPNQIRPVRGQRGHYRANVRHGVSRVRSGTRHTLGVIFHDAV